MNERHISAEQALQCIKSGIRVFIHGSASTPVCLVQVLQARHNELNNVELVSITNIGDLNFEDPEYKKNFFFNSLFVSATTPNIANSLNGDYVPVFLILRLYRFHRLTSMASVH